MGGAPVFQFAFDSLPLGTSYLPFFAFSEPTAAVVPLTVLCVLPGTTENATVVEGLLGELADRGVNFQQPRLYLVDGSKAIRRGILTYAGDAAFIQRCQVHKIRNVSEYLPESQRPAVKFRMRAAYLMAEASDSRQALYRLHDELMTENPSAAGSLAEGLEETLTVSELRLTPKLR